MPSCCAHGNVRLEMHACDSAATHQASSRSGPSSACGAARPQDQLRACRSAWNSGPHQLPSACYARRLHDGILNSSVHAAEPSLGRIVMKAAGASSTVPSMPASALQPTLAPCDIGQAGTPAPVHTACNSCMSPDQDSSSNRRLGRQKHCWLPRIQGQLARQQMLCICAYTYSAYRLSCAAFVTAHAMGNR